MTLDQRLADAAEQATTLRRFGATGTAEAVERLVADLRQELRAYLTWREEPEAVELSGNSAPWFRARFAYFQRLGLAKGEGRRRYYRETLVRAVARRADIEAIHDEAEQAHREDTAA